MGAFANNIAEDELFSWKYNTFHVVSHTGYDDNRLSYINSTGGGALLCAL